MKDVVVYCRVACAKRSDPEAQRQEQMVRRYTDALGLIICETYRDAGVSAGLERAGIGEFLKVVWQTMDEIGVRRSFGGARGA